MQMHAYSEEYLPYAQRILGDMLDFTVNSCEEDPEKFYQMFLVSGVAEQFETGNPAYVIGRTGCELAREVYLKSGLPEPDVPDEMYLDKSPEYWAGWILAYYQWYTCRSFRKMYKVISLEGIIRMYDVFHEMDPMQFVDAVNEKWDACYAETNLKRIRTYAGLTQAALAQISGVSLRQIQLFEQRKRDINKAQAISVLKIGKALGCRPEELLEI